MSKDELGRLLANTNSGAGGYELTEQARADAKEAVTSQLSTGRHSRAFYRVSATRSATGGKDMVGQEAKIKAMARAAPTDAEAGGGKAGQSLAEAQLCEPKPAIQFVNVGVSVNENEKFLDLEVHVTGPAHTETISAQFDSVSGTATAGEDFEAVSGRVDFLRGQTERTIRIP